MRGGGAGPRLSLADVTGELARLVGGVGASMEDLLERYGGIAGPAADDADPGALRRARGSGTSSGSRTTRCRWAEVLEPAGWRCVSGNEMGISADEHEQVWERPGKGGKRAELSDR